MKKYLIISTLTVLLFIFASTANATTTTSTSIPLAPDSLFYFLKTWKESIQIFFTLGVENKAKQYLHLAEVRLAEYQKMLEKGKTKIAEKTLEKYEKQLNYALEKAEELKQKGKDIKDLSEQVEQVVSKHLEVLQDNLQKVPEQAKKGIENAIENSSKVLERIQKHAEKEQGCINSGGATSTSLCCKATSDFPNSCAIGACGCAPEYSHQVKICECGSDKCFNGKLCVVLKRGR